MGDLEGIECIFTFHIHIYNVKVIEKYFSENLLLLANAVRIFGGRLAPSRVSNLVVVDTDDTN